MIAHVAILGAGIACSPFDQADSPPASVPPGAAGADAAVSDAAALDGGSVDAADADRTGFCADAGTVTLCDDFERSANDVKGPWQVTARPEDPTTLAIVEDVSTSPRRSLLVTVPATVYDGWTFLHAAPAPGARVVDLSFSLRIAAGPTGNNRYVMVELGTVSKVYVLWNSSNQVLRLVERVVGSLPTEELFDTLGAPPIDQFVRYRLVVDLDKATASVTTDLANLRAGLALRVTEQPFTLVGFGNMYTPGNSAGGGGERRFWFDDVVLR